MSLEEFNGMSVRTKIVDFNKPGIISETWLFHILSLLIKVACLRRTPRRKAQHQKGGRIAGSAVAGDEGEDRALLMLNMADQKQVELERTKLAD